MKEISFLPQEGWSRIKVLLTDIDDTVTTDGRLTSEAYCSLEALQDAGYIESKFFNINCYKKSICEALADIVRAHW